MSYVSEFSSDGKLFAIIHSDGRLKIWDTESNTPTQEYVPNLHLSTPCTCFIWVNVVGEKSKKKSKVKYDDANTTLYIALGTSKGGVEMYSYATGKIEFKLQGDGHAGAVTSICLKDENTLYTSGEDCRIVEWSLSRGSQTSSWSVGNDKPTCIIFLPLSNRLLVGCRELKLWSTETGCEQLLYTFTGHTSEVNSLKMLTIDKRSRAQEFVLSTANDREISLWQIKLSSKYKNARATFLMENKPVFVNCSVNSAGDIRLAAVTSTGVVHLFIVEQTVITDGHPTPVKPKVTILLACDSEPTPVPIYIVAASLHFSAKDSQNIFIGYGDAQCLRFENIKYNPDKKKETLVRQDPRKIVAGQEKTKDNLKTVAATINDVNTEYQVGSSVPRKRNTNNVVVEMPMETRLENLNLGDVPKSKNLAKLLTQALHSHNADLLRTVFITKDESVIRSTLQQLPPQYITDLVDELTMLTQKKTANVQVAVCWLKILLQTHASQLMALGTNELFSRFGPLLGNIENRTEVLKPLSKLSGRLDLLMCQIKRNTDDDDAIFNRENVLVYEDKDSDDEQDFEVTNGYYNSTDEEGEEEEEESDVDDEKMDES